VAPTQTRSRGVSCPKPLDDACSRNGSDLHRTLSPGDLADYRHCEEERPPGRGRENRTLAYTVMGRDGAPARTARVDARGVDVRVERSQGGVAIGRRIHATNARAWRVVFGKLADKERRSGLQRPLGSHAEVQSDNRAPTAREHMRSSERVVPPRELEPQPTSFAALCPFLGTVANRSSQWRESNPAFVRA
jgi:hypothetical protein